MPYEPDDLYIDQTRVEWADRYGGVGAGKGGGSGRCSSFDGLQTKGVGRTALAPPEGDENHSSGTLVLLEAAAEAVFSRIYQIALPFGAVPVHAIIWTGGRFIRGRSGGMQDIRMRTLAVRPFVARPAHFMRNPDFMPGREPAGAEFRGLSADAARVKIALGALARNLSHAMGLQNDPSRDVTHDAARGVAVRGCLCQTLAARNPQLFQRRVKRSLSRLWLEQFSSHVSACVLGRQSRLVD
jgi:hypothetical protein